MSGITSLYYSFRGYLAKQARKIALLQLTGRIEDFLVREFIYYAWTKGIFSVSNIGNKKEQKLDICLLKGNVSSPKIFGMIEAKYFRNIHRYKIKSNATDEIESVLKELNRQLHTFEKSKHANFRVRLISRAQNIYGLVFASYVSGEINEKKKKRFYNIILGKAERYFKYHDLLQPYFRPIFDDIKIDVLKTPFYVTLKCGLWRRK